MPGPRFPGEADFDDQDQSETFDESMTVGGEGDSALDGEFPLDVEDVTRADGDRDDDEGVALNAGDFDDDVIGDGDLEEDNELDYRAATVEHEDDLDGLGPEDGFDEDRISASEIDGLEEVRDASEAEGGEDDVTDFQAREVSDDDLMDMGYSEDRDGVAVARPDRG